MRALAILTTLATLIAAPTALATIGKSSAPQRMQVTQDEWFINLSRAKLRPGKAIIEVVNFGQDAHDLAILRKAKGAKTVRVPKHDHFMRAEVTVSLVAGSYTLWCTLPQHRKRGMWATLTVK
jgi:uncharacterized cupredoxin-like copper-binding protein